MEAFKSVSLRVGKCKKVTCTVNDGHFLLRYYIILKFPKIVIDIQRCFTESQTLMRL
jgi:hypothetical protein